MFYIRKVNEEEYQLVSIYSTKGSDPSLHRESYNSPSKVFDTQEQAEWYIKNFLHKRVAKEISSQESPHEEDNR